MYKIYDFSDMKSRATYNNKQHTKELFKKDRVSSYKIPNMP